MIVFANFAKIKKEEFECLKFFFPKLNLIYIYDLILLL